MGEKNLTDDTIEVLKIKQNQCDNKHIIIIIVYLFRLVIL
jgi:hypothetical protein